ncbi:YsnF/AvaK domain-containing protein [Planomicrobium sp. Y74]|uniref:YsnF/AvaK domain-containing protein n=1 Tax=Planomicrobium sp. Y74 TaxID=2478977 RepID=UPI000EF53CD6|nr:YsnF/AvaK domain-containing protein [Planomicrobium sp. Y74]RLQ83852.1 YsnF/AvaK domain-containing protein [Planomicrobium sp. Y74]
MVNNNNNNNDKLVGTFELQAQVFKKIEELKEQGYREEDMYVVAKDGANIDTLQDKTRTNITSGDKDSNWKDKFTNLFSSDDTERSSYRNVSDDNTRDTDYHSHVENGRILLYVDQDFAGSSGTYATGSRTGTGTGSDLSRDNYSGTGTGTDEESLKLHEERLNVDKERVQTGEVNVGKHVVEEEQSIDVPVEHEEVYVERRPVNEESGSGLTDRDRLDGKDSIHVDVNEERVNVSKDDVVSEELVVGKRKVKDTEHVSETVRREEADIDEDNNANKGLFNDKDNKRGL